MQLLERVTAIEDGRRLLRLLADPGAEKSRRPRRAGVIDGTLLDGVHLGGDALVDVAAQRVPRAWTLLVDDPRQTGSELRATDT